jgi:hypothetical protein
MNKKYKMIQISEESHILLKEWCEKNDKKMSKVIERWIDENTKNIQTNEKNILRVQTNR